VDAIKKRTLSELRAQAQLTQKQLADVSGYGVQYISDLERGVRRMGGVSLRGAIRMADALHCDVRELLPDEEDPQK